MSQWKIDKLVQWPIVYSRKKRKTGNEIELSTWKIINDDRDHKFHSVNVETVISKSDTTMSIEIYAPQIRKSINSNFTIYAFFSFFSFSFLSYLLYFIYKARYSKVRGRVVIPILGAYTI